MRRYHSDKLNPRQRLRRWLAMSLRRDTLTWVSAAVALIVLGVVLVIRNTKTTKMAQNDSGVASSNALGAKTSNSPKDSEGTRQPTPKPSSGPTTKPLSPTTPLVTPASTPASVLNLALWKITLPTDTVSTGKADEVLQPQLTSFSQEPYFFVAANKAGVAFRAPVGGVTTSGSNYPRSELREMAGTGRQNASWSSTSGVHKMTIRQAITHLPAVKADVVAGQIHDSNEDIIEIRLKKSTLYVDRGGDDIGILDANYQLGAFFTVEISVSDGVISVSYNGSPKVSKAMSGSGWYFKAGCYTQSNPTKGDAASDYGEVIISSLSVSHS